MRQLALWLLLSVPHPCSAGDAFRVPPDFQRIESEIRGLMQQMRRSRTELEDLAGSYIADPDLRRVERQRHLLRTSLQEDDLRLSKALGVLRRAATGGIVTTMAPVGLKNLGKEAAVHADLVRLVTYDRTINDEVRAFTRAMREVLAMDADRFEAGLKMRRTLRGHRLLVVAGLFAVGLLLSGSVAVYLEYRRAAPSPAAGAGEAEPRALSDDSAPKSAPVRPSGPDALFSGGFMMGLITFMGIALMGNAALVTLCWGDIDMVANHAQFIRALLSLKGFVAGSVFLFTGAAFASGLVSGLLGKSILHSAMLLGLVLSLLSAACLGGFGFPWSHSRMMALLSIIGVLWSSLCLYYLRKVRELAIAENGGGPS